MKPRTPMWTAGRNPRERHRLLLGTALALALLVTAAAAAQPAGGPPMGGPPNALQGFSQNRNQPIQIQSASLELRDKEKTATFNENVHLVQGDTTLECKKLIVHYGDDAPVAGGAAKSGAAGKTAAVGGPAMGGGPQQIRKLEAMGGVVVTQKEQTATGDVGLFDMKTNSVTLTGNVVITQGQNVVRGDRLWVDLNTGVSRVESGAPGTPGGTGRVQGLFLPSSAQQAKPPAPAAAPGPGKPAPKTGASPAATPAGSAPAVGATGGAAGVTGSTRPATAGTSAGRPSTGSGPKPAAPQPN